MLRSRRMSGDVSITNLHPEPFFIQRVAIQNIFSRGHIEWISVRICFLWRVAVTRGVNGKLDLPLLRPGEIKKERAQSSRDVKCDGDLELVPWHDSEEQDVSKFTRESSRLVEKIWATAPGESSRFGQRRRRPLISRYRCSREQRNCDCYHK